MQRVLTCFAVAMGLLLCVAPRASAQLRIVTYNTATGQSGNPSGQVPRQPYINTILQAIGAESSNAGSKPIDILMLQEQFTMAGTTQAFVDALNDIYDPVNRTMYKRGTATAGASSPDGGRPGVVYNSETVTLLPIAGPTFGEAGIGQVGATLQARQAMRYRFRPVGYESGTADFWTYVSHYKAGDANSISSGSTTNGDRRQVEATNIRANADNVLGEGAHIIYAGDYNVQSSAEQSFQTLMAPGPGQAFDPINQSGVYNSSYVSWNNNSTLRWMHTQAPNSTAYFSGQTTGGMDDRFDFQMVTAEMLDGEGMSYIAGTYHAFGNNGTHQCCNSEISTGTGASATVLDALKRASDHLPVVADYQLPAKMIASIGSVPSMVTLGATIPISVLVDNVAPALNTFGADELDFTVSVSGDLTGSAMGAIPALSGSVMNDVFLNTSTAGMKSGVITVMTTSQGAANPLFNFPVSFTVLNPGPTFLAADFNEDSSVNEVDLAAWTANFGLDMGAVKSQGDANADGLVDGADLAVWQQQLGSPPPMLAAVPEPASAMIALVAGLAFAGSRRKNR